jgi:phenylpropionate dioxygenase-like ring-hydroxylating dioxygenase large terminal subunit
MITEAPGREAIAAYNAALSEYWHPVLDAADLADAPVAVQLLDRPLVLVRLDGDIACMDDVCRHMGASLSLGTVVDGCALRCIYHGWSYDASGRVVDIPTRRGRPVPTGARVASYRVQERYGIVWVCLSDQPAADVPAFPEYDDPAFRTTPLAVYAPWRATAPRLVMGALDDTHFPWVHPGILGDPDQPEAPDHTARRDDGVLIASYSRTAPNEVVEPGAPPMMEVNRDSYCTPTSIRLVKSMPHWTLVIFEAVSPVSYDRSVAFIHMARTYDLDPARDQHYVDFEAEVQEQDRPVVESQRPWLLPPLSSRLLLYVRDADLPLIEFQKWLEELGIPQL